MTPPEDMPDLGELADETDEMDGCEVDMTADPVPDEDLEGLLAPRDVDR